MIKSDRIQLRFFLLLIAAVTLVLCIEQLGLYAGIDTYFYDTLLRLRGNRSVSDRIVIVGIDSAALDAFGKWPLKRRHYADMLGRSAQANAVGFDLLLTEPSADDDLLETAIKRHGKVVLAEYVDSSLSVVKPLKRLSPYATGHIHIEPGIDSTAREVFHTLYHSGVMLQSLTSVIYNMVSGSSMPRHKPPQAIAENSNDKLFQQDRHRINFYGPPRTFKQVSLADVNSDVIAPEYFRGKIVLVGLTAPGIVDEVSTPFSQARNRMPGVEVHANILNNLLEKSAITESPGWLRAVTSLFISLIMAFLLLKQSEKKATLIWIFSLIAWGTAVATLLFTRNLWLSPTATYISLSLMYFITYLRRLDTAARRLDKEHEVMISLLGWDAHETPVQMPGRGLFGFLSEESLNGKIQRQLRMTAKLLVMHKQLETTLKMEREVLANQRRLVEMLSHEYRTPLAIIRANLDILEMKDGAAGGLLTSNFGKMKRAMSRLVEVMEVSLGRERLENIHQKSDHVEIQLVPFIRDLMNETRELWSERRLELELHGDGECIVIGDRSLLKTALLNLIDNAVKYSAENEPVCVSLDTTETSALVRVRNHGVVIPTEDLDKVFDKFYRGTGSGNTRGAGLGLFLVRCIIEQLQGNVTLTSNEADGTVASATLPIR